MHEDFRRSIGTAHPTFSATGLCAGGGLQRRSSVAAGYYCERAEREQRLSSREAGCPCPSPSGLWDARWPKLALSHLVLFHT